MKTKRRYHFYPSILMIGILLFIQVLQVKHVFGEVHHRKAHHNTQQLISYEMGCPVCEYLIHQQPRHILYSTDLLIKPVEKALRTSRVLPMIRYQHSYYTLLGNKSPPKFA